MTTRHTHKRPHPHGPSLNHPHGKLSLAPDADAPLLIVFGGIPVGPKDHKVRSGIYMWNYMANLRDKFHIFVAESHRVNGTESYLVVTKTLQEKGLTPSRQILYLFSGGYGPGKRLLTSSDPKLFSSIYLVDIWMGNDAVADFYMTLVDKNATKLTYVYTDGGGANPTARDHIKKTLGRSRAIHVSNGHMNTNVAAVRTLQQESA